jgi:hypothetical protein
LKNLTRVTPETVKLPHNHKTILFPKYGIAVTKLVITVAPQKLIWPQGKT